MIFPRVLFLVLIIAAGVVGAAIHEFLKIPEHMAAAELRITRGCGPATGAPPQSSSQETLLSEEDFEVQIILMKSLALVDSVSRQLPRELKAKVLEPRQAGNIFTGSLRDIEVIMECYDVEPVKGSFIANVTYKHPEPDVAIAMAQYFAKQIVENNKEDRCESIDPAIEQMELRVVALAREIENLHKTKATLIQKAGEKNALQSELNAAMPALELARKKYEDTKELRGRPAELKKEGKPATTLAAIAVDERLIAVEKKVATVAGIALGWPTDSSKANDAKLTSAREELEKLKAERAEIIAAGEAKIEQDFLLAEKKWKDAKTHCAELNEKINHTGNAGKELELLGAKIEAAEKEKTRLETECATEKLKITNVRTHIRLFQDAALVSNRPINKNYFSAGVTGAGIGAAIVCVLLLFWTICVFLRKAPTSQTFAR